MTKLGERLGKWDDRTVMYRADGGPTQTVRPGRWILSEMAVTAVVGLAIWGIGALIGAWAAIITVLVLSIAFLVGYVTWRRRRNKRLTGATNCWPTP